MKYVPPLVRQARYALILSALITGTTQADEVKSLRGKPSSDAILEALSPAGATATEIDAPVKRRRGLSLSSDEPAAPTPPSASQTHAAPVSYAPERAAQPQLRALDLDIQFKFASDELTIDGKDVLDQLAAALKSEKLANARSVILEGHADAKGSASYNKALSLKRALSARQYLSSRHGISGSKLNAVGKGSSEPADPSNPESEVNRRVRVILTM